MSFGSRLRTRRDTFAKCYFCSAATKVPEKTLTRGRGVVFCRQSCFASYLSSNRPSVPRNLESASSILSRLNARILELYQEILFADPRDVKSFVAQVTVVELQKIESGKETVLPKQYLPIIVE